MNGFPHEGQKLLTLFKQVKAITACPSTNRLTSDLQNIRLFNQNMNTMLIKGLPQ
jgi:hypothetical protein